MTMGLTSGDGSCIDNTRVVIPKHTEVNELTGQGICKTLEPELGEGWWR
ncbi:hypothetical protein [Streptomyces sp. NPDC055299]